MTLKVLHILMTCIIELCLKSHDKEGCFLFVRIGVTHERKDLNSFSSRSAEKLVWN